MRNLLSFLPRLWANWITLLGSVITTFSGVAILVFLAFELVAQGPNPYTSGMLILVLPPVFLFGLAIIPIGLWIDRRRHRRSGAPLPGDPITDAFRNAIREKVTRRRIIFVAVASLLNILIFSMAGHEAVKYMDSPKFCGTTCHTVMQPEWNAYNGSSHSRVACVQCHIGPGASWAVKSKINGLSQVWGVLTGDYHRPIPSPVEHLRPSRDTCEQCHWPEKFTGNKLQIYPHYKQDKDNTPVFNAVLLRVGGRNPKNKKYEGIHWHTSVEHVVKYEVLDKERMKIGKITVIENGKTVAEYMPPKPAAGQPELKVLGERTIDCVDCHNRPTHVFDRGPKNAVDKAMYAGLLDAKVPFLAEVSAAVLKTSDVKREDAEAHFRKALEETYAKTHADAKPAADVLDKTAKTLADIYRKNVYPEMKLGWGTYKSHIGHQSEKDETLGCFRCHDKEHEAKLADGTTKTLKQDCEMCHETLAAEEDPTKFDESLQALLPKE